MYLNKKYIQVYICIQCDSKQKETGEAVEVEMFRVVQIYLQPVTNTDVLLVHQQNNVAVLFYCCSSFNLDPVQTLLDEICHLFA